ncbi:MULTISPECIES: ABC transporter ATP-binding protein SaoA [Jonquetella]|uniref:ABC-type nitrate/sulfonate/bicarbonate transport system, ATPase component n=1 Tax=Jonquetella anthropi DSM 22815 TaxID=885272 RepID=H0UJX0_9BACT|nr:MULTISPECIES: ABC transporter ATP-binding protein SaoA [Jonquetella]EHM12980.1 ABC-type nitrate/sulfonate/bicarbonate transport system, ATPase component [Jonquetella anthropi DSM 22815]ERL23527.1 ABC transporter, ATP-binding protein [Jonquetella sp. BV3C21]
MAQLAINHVKKFFIERNGSTHFVIGDLSFQVEQGQFVSLLGPSGCGKTTLLTIMAGFQTCSEGSITLDGQKIEGPGVERGYVFQNYALFPWMTVKDNILYSMKIAGASRKEKEERLAELLELAHLKGHENKFPIQLSGGMQQRVAVVRALASRPKVLLLDEPLGAIDFQMREIMQNELDLMVRQVATTVVMVTHDVSESVFLSDRVLVMGSNGCRLLADVTIDMPRPRDRTSEQFKTYESDLTDLLRKAFRESKLIESV